MTQRVTVTNNKDGGPYIVEVRVFNRNYSGGIDAEDVHARKALEPGEGMDVYIHAARYFTVTELEAKPVATEQTAVV